MNTSESSPNLESFAFKPRLEIKHLLWATALLAAGLAFHETTIAYSLVVIVLWALHFASSSNWVVYLLVFLGLFASLAPAVQQVRSTPHYMYCLNNVRQLVMAIHNYESSHGRLPCDSVTTNSKGETIRTSWRVHILPFLEYEAQYAAYQFDQPWDSPTNLAVQDQVAGRWGFTCTGHDHGSKTPYKVVVGPGTAFETGKETRLEDCKDGSANTIILVEDHSDPVHFFEPRDISVADVVKLFNNSSKDNCAHKLESTFSRRHMGFNFALLDSSTHIWPTSTQTVVDEGAFLIADSKFFDPETDISSCVEYRWDRIISLTIYLLLVLYPLLWRHDKKLVGQLA